MRCASFAHLFQRLVWTIVYSDFIRAYIHFWSVNRAWRLDKKLVFCVGICQRPLCDLSKVAVTILFLWWYVISYLSKVNMARFEVGNGFLFRDQIRKIPGEELCSTVRLWVSSSFPLHDVPLGMLMQKRLRNWVFSPHVALSFDQGDHGVYPSFSIKRKTFSF